MVLHQIKAALEEGGLTLEESDSLLGRMTSYMEILEHARWERGFLLSMFRNTTDKKEVVKLNKLLEDQLHWWRITLLRGKLGWPIESLKPRFRNYHLTMHCDAAGGSLNSNNGYGGIVWLHTGERPWVMGKWCKDIQENKKMSWGKEFGKDMSVLEAGAILACMTACRRWLRGRPVLNICDNAGTVWGIRKGRSTNLFLYTILKAIVEIAEGLDIELRVEHANRMTNAGDRIADALSKGDIQRAKKEWGNVRPSQEKVPDTVLNWFRQPYLTRNLSQEVLAEIEKLDGKHSVIWRPSTGINYTTKDWSEIRKWYEQERKKEQTKHARADAQRKRKAAELADKIGERKKTKWWTNGNF